MSKIPTSVTDYEIAWCVFSVITEQDQSKIAGYVITSGYCVLC